MNWQEVDDLYGFVYAGLFLAGGAVVAGLQRLKGRRSRERTLQAELDALRATNKLGQEFFRAQARLRDLPGERVIDGEWR